MPEYPASASAAGVEGEVLVDFAISRDGTVSDLMILASEPPFLFDGVALNAVRSWVYETSDSDEPRRVTVRFPFEVKRPTENPMLVLERVDESELDPIERRGRDMYEYSVAAARAKAALVRMGHLSELRHYIVAPERNGSSVRFLDDRERVFADVLVDLFSPELEQVTVHEAPIPLPADQHEMWSARVAAVSLSRERHLSGCTENAAFVVLPSLEADRSWDVYVLSVSPGSSVVPIGGHYRISISRDPKISPQLYAYSGSCASPTSSSDSQRVMITETKARTPTEVHIYLSLLYRRPLAVAIHDDGGLWFVENGRMRRAESRQEQ
jgi:TonB family protein